MFGGRFTTHRGGLCIAVAALMPVPAALSGQPLSQLGAPPPAGASVTSITAAPTVPVPAEVPPVVIKHDSSKHGKHRHDGRKHKKHAVIKSSQHERILEISANTSYDVPLAALNAYRNAAARVSYSYPGCNLSWGVIAAIGQVESGHGRFSGASVLANGKTTPRIVGVPLNGHGVARIPDTDNGVLDGDKVWDRAVGPMQFIPSTWANIGIDGDGDGRRDPNDFDDAALATGLYLCSGYGDFSILAQARANVLRYNHSEEYVDLVLRIANAYDSGVVDVVPNDTAPPRVRHRRPAVRHPHTTVRHHTTHHAPAPTRPKPSPTPTPAPPPPVVRTHTGTWHWTSLDSGKVGTFVVALPLPVAVRATLTGDVNGDGHLQGLWLELEGLSGGSVSVTTTDGKVTAFVVNSTPPPPAPATTPTPTSPTTTSP
jgi:hypothetical protein